MKLIIDTYMGTRVLGSKFGHLQLTYRHDQYDHAVSSTLNYYSDWWLLARVDDGLIDYAAQVNKKFGVKLHTRTLWGAHVSVIRGVEPVANVEKWGLGEGKIAQIKYTHEVYTNGADVNFSLIKGGDNEVATMTFSDDSAAEFITDGFYMSEGQTLTIRAPANPIVNNIRFTLRAQVSFAV